MRKIELYSPECVEYEFSAVYRVLKRWIEEGEQSLEDKPHGRSSGVRKVDLKAIEAIRRLQQNPHLGASACTLR
jgi:hypothetical protein